MSEQPTGAVLCGDIGGSNTRLAIWNGSGLERRRQFENARAPGLADILAQYLTDTPRPVRACLAVAGPTDGRSVRLTNLAWRIDADDLGRTFGLPFRLANDFEAIAWGLDSLSPDGFTAIQAAAPPEHAPRLAIGPGTGLGVAISAWTASGYRPLPGEGGHIGFAPSGPRQEALLGFLRERYGRASAERILSGPGIVDLYAFCGGSARSAAEITAAALEATDPAAVEALQLFCRILGQTAGDLALAAGARGGVYIAGGIPPRILPLLADGGLLAGFLDKGRFGNWMREVPLWIVTDPDIGLKGAAQIA